MRFMSQFCKGIFTVVIPVLFCVSLSSAQDMRDDLALNQSQTVRPTSEEPKGTDELFVNGGAYNFDQYLFRKNVSGGRSRFGVFINRFYSNLMKFDANGFLTNANDLISRQLLPPKAVLTMRIFDVDHDSQYDGNQDGIPDPEVDYVYINGKRVQDISGKPLTLSSGNQTWSIWSAEIPIEWLKFPRQLGTATNKPSAENSIEIDIDVPNTGYWAVTCDWISIEIASPIRPVVMIHGVGLSNVFGGSPKSWDVTRQFFHQDGIPHHVPTTGVINPSGSIESNAQGINSEVNKLLNIFGVDKVNLLVHSKGGLDSRMYVRTYGGDKIERIVQLATPNHGSEVADLIYLACLLSPSGGGCIFITPLRQLTTWWIEQNFNYQFSFFGTLQGPRYTEQNDLPINILVGNIYPPIAFVFPSVNDGLVSVFSATLPWNTGFGQTISSTRFNDGEYALNHIIITDSPDVYKKAIELFKSPFSGQAQRSFITESKSFYNSPTVGEKFEVVFRNVEAIVANQAKLVNVNLESTAQANFVVGSINNDFSLRLFDPMNKVYDVTSPEFFKFVSGVGYVMQYRIQNPTTGMWKIEIVSPNSSDIIAEVRTSSSQKFSNQTNKVAYARNEPIQISATLVDGTVPIIGAQVLARIIKNDATEETLSLFDNGTNNDPTANDGVYNNIYSGTSVAGSLDIITTATKTPLTRISEAHVTVVPNSANFSGIYSEQVVDVNGNGLFDILSITTGVNISVVGHYSLSGNLRDATGKLIASAAYSSLGQSPLTLGAQLLKLDFDGRSISAGGSNGPYKFTEVTLTDLNNNSPIQIGYQQQPFTTKLYLATSFERSLFSLTGKNDDKATDTDGDGKFDFLNITLELSVAIAGNYNFNAQLVDQIGNNIDWTEKSANLNAGINTLTLTFDGLEISEKGLDGPYTLTNFSIFSDASGIFQSFLNVYTTSAYQSTQFAGFNITGTVKDKTSGTPIFNAKVILGGKKTAIDSTNSSGLFRFGGLARGNYWVVAKLGNAKSDTSFVSVPPDANLNLSLVVASTVPAIFSINPNNGQPGQAFEVTITGANFVNGATVSFSGTGVNANPTNFVSASQLTANINIDPNAAAGPRDLIVRNPNGQSATGAGLFNVVGCGPAAATFADNFESGTDNWLARTPTSWGINLIGSDQVLCLGVPNAVRDEYMIQRGEPWLDFDLTLEAKSDATSNKNFFIIFGTTDFRSATNKGYYLQFALGGVKLYRSTGGGSGVEIASAARDYVSDNLFHRIRVERKRPNIQVTVDGTLIINVNDGAFAIGSIGFGSFNSQACFDDVNISGARAEPSFYIDAFDDGDATGWSPLTPSRWQVSNENGSLRYLINTTNYEPPNSTRLGELSVLTGKSWGDFVFECHAKSADAATANENADLCLVFGYQDFDSYYYVNFNTAPGLTQLFRTHNGVNTVLATYAQSTFLAGDVAYHALRVERSGSEIRAYFDGREVLASNDSFFGAGLVGLGSYNDAGYFDNIAVTKKCEALPPTPAELVADKIFLRTGQNSGPEVTDPVAGQSYYLHFNWRNAGGVASSFRLQLKLNSAVICEYNSGTIAAGSLQNSWCTTPIVWPLSNAEIVIEGVLDPNNVINEPNESNNIVGQTFPPNAQTNLTATTLVFSPAAVTRGNSINLSGAVTNNGAVPTGAGFKVSFYLSTNSGAPDLSLLLGSFTMTALNAGQSNSFSLSGTVPATTPAPAQYFVWMSVDADNAITESNESDNLLRATSQLSVTILPAAGIRPVTAFPQYAIGAEFVVDITVNDATNLFGLSFELNYTNTAFIDVVTPTNSNVLPGPFLGNDIVFIYNVDEPAGKVGIGVSRKSGQGGVSGSGVVASIRFKSLTSAPPNTPIVFTVSSVSASDPNGAAIPLTASSHTVNIVGVVVWPGDTNNDGIVNQADVLPLGLYWNRTGPPRSRITCEWSPQVATPWPVLAATYADANGDGVVNQADVLCIGLNWGRTHTTLLAKPEEGRMIDAAPIRMSTRVIGSVNPGEDFEIAVAAEQTENLFGAAFELLYAPASLLDPQSITAGNLLGDDVVFFPNVDHNAGKISVGLSRKAGQDGVAGKGVVAKIRMRLASQTLHGQAITLTLQEMTINNPAGQLLPVQSAVGSSIIVGVGSRRSGALPTAFKLQQNSPNPFNPATEIFYDLPEPSDVHLEIFDMLGKHVRTLVQERQNAGSYSAIWDSRDANGQMVASGVYLYQLRAGTFSQTRRMSLLR